MDPSRWPLVKDTVHAVLAHPRVERDAQVRQRCGDDAALRAEVESLLAAIEQAGSFIEQPALHSSLALNMRALEPGSSLGSYTVLEFVGAGGMAEVYRARDATLNRDVALKVRPAVAPLDADRLARVRREAQILAALNHPNVAVIHGLEDSDGVQALVLELVEGATLQERIAEGPIPIAQALSIATQIAEGLRAAHDRGIIHSDLKPANIKLRPDGTVKILDFGLARMLQPAAATPRTSGDAADAATVESSHWASGRASAVSSTGLVFGTAAYMSPEQVRGDALDERADIWAFGCVLYEMLTGRPAFRGDTVDAILADVLAREPDWRALPAATPATIDRLLKTCLEKPADRRPRDLTEARTAIAEASSAMALSASGRRHWRAAAAIAAMAVAAIALVVAAPFWQAKPATTATMKRLQIRLPDEGPLARPWTMPLGLGQLSMAVAPDGTRLVYVMERDGVSRLYLHGLEQPAPVEIPATEGAFGPFFSPDAQWVGFFADNKLKKVAVAGGAAIELCDAPNPYGGSWGTDGTIVFSPNEGRQPARIQERGGAASLIQIRNAQGSYRRPDLLPDGKAAIVSNPQLGVGVLSFDTGEFALLVPNAGGGRYAAGHLVYARPGMLVAAPFDPDRRAIVGPEVVIVDGVRTEAEGVSPHPQAVVSGEGTLVYAPGGAADMTTPVWVDRRGRIQSTGMPPRSYRTMSLSPDGRLLAIVIARETNDLWVQDLQRGTLTRRTSGIPVAVVNWTADGQRIVFGSRRDGQRQAFSVRRDGGADPEPYVAGDGQAAAGAPSPDGQFVATFKGGAGMGMDLWVLPLRKGDAARLFLQTRFDEVGPAFSPDGRWIAYVSDESGRYEVYVRPFPARDGKWQVSVDGGEEPRWSRDGAELFYRNGRTWMAAAVTLNPAFTAKTPARLFEGHYANVGGRSYDVAADGRRFLVLQASNTAAVTQLNIVLHWEQQLTRQPGPVR
jgi:serine/threonine protein kinase/Tol biopolymer transport system component